MPGSEFAAGMPEQILAAPLRVCTAAPLALGAGLAAADADGDGDADGGVAG